MYCVSRVIFLFYTFLKKLWDLRGEFALKLNFASRKHYFQMTLEDPREYYSFQGYIHTVIIFCNIGEFISK
jgi:hypothetical protein